MKQDEGEGRKGKCHAQTHRLLLVKPEGSLASYSILQAMHTADLSRALRHKQDFRAGEQGLFPLLQGSWKPLCVACIFLAAVVELQTHKEMLSGAGTPGYTICLNYSCLESLAQN